MKYHQATFSWELFAVLLLVLALDVRADPITVTCEGRQIGVIDLNPSDGSVAGHFTVRGFFPSLAAAAQFCGEDHFNWLQIVVVVHDPPVTGTGTPLQPPFIDPPRGGYGNDPSTPGDDTLWADDFLGYWNEGPIPNPRPPGFREGLHLDDNTTLDTLDFLDIPSHPDPNQFIIFQTFLASMNADHTLHSTYGGYTWTWTNRPGGGTVSNFQAIPEPTTVLLLGTGLAGVAASVRRRRQSGKGKGT